MWGCPVADEIDYGSARITLDLDDTDAERQARDVGRDIERALTRATRNLGRRVRNNITRGLRGLSVSVRVMPEVDRRFERQLRQQLGTLAAVTVPVTADMSRFRRGLFRRGGDTGEVTIPVLPDTRRFLRVLRQRLRDAQVQMQVRADASRMIRDIQRQLRAIDPPRITVEVEADLSRVRSQLSSLDAPDVEVAVTADTTQAREELQELEDEQIDVPIEVGGEGGASAAGAAAGTAVLGGLAASLRAAGPWAAIAGAVAAYGGLIGQALMTGIEGVIEHQQIAGTLQAALGLSADAAHRAGRVAGQLYARGVVETVEDGAAAVQAAIRNGLVAPDDLPGLESIATKISDIGQLMEEDIGKVARAVGTMVKTGLVKNASEGLDLLMTSVQRGGNIAEDLLDTFSEYPTQFRQLGLSAEEAFGLIQQGLRGGARDSDVIADALKEFSIEAAQAGDRVVEAFEAMELDADRLTQMFAKGGPEARKALDEVFDALKKIEDPLERNQVAVGLFGTKAEDLAGAVGALDLDTAAKEMDKFGGAAERAGNSLRDNLGNKLQTIAREVKQAFQGIFAGDFSQIADVGRAVQEALPDLKETGKHIAEGIEQGIREYGPKVFDAVFRLASELGERVDIWGPLLLKIAAGAAALPAIAGALILTGLAGGLKGIGVKLLPYLEEAWDAVVDFFTETIPAWGSELGGQIGDALSSAWETASGAVSTGIDKVAEFFTSLPERISSGASSLGSTISEGFSQAMEWGKQAVSDGIDAIIDFFVQLPGRLWQGMQNLGVFLLDIFTSAIAYVIIGLLTAVAGIVFVFTELPGRIWNALQSLGEFLLNAFITGWNTLTSWLQTATTNVIDFFVQLPGRIYNGLLSLGAFLVNAFVTGFNAARSRITSWITETVAFFRALPGRIQSALATFGAFLLRNIVAGFTAARSRISSWATQTISFFRQLPSRIFSALSSLGSRLSSAFSTAGSAARRAVSALINGIVTLFRELPRRIMGAIGNIGSQIMSKVKAGLPSSVRKYLPFADGGVVLSPTHALIGEAGPEVVIPLTRPQRARQLAEESGLLDILRDGSRGRRDGRPAPTVNQYVTIHEVGDARLTAHRVTTRLALAGGLL